MKSKGNPYQQPAGYGTSATIPAQSTGGKSGTVKAGVGMGVMDRCGPDNRFAGGTHSGVQYVHDRKSQQPG